MIGFSRNLATVLLGWALFVMTSYTWAQEPEAVLYLPQITEPQEKEILHIGVVASDTSEIQEGLLQPTLKRLHEKLPRYRFEISTLDEFEIYLSAVNKVVDFYIAPSGTFAYMQDSGGATYLATNQGPGVRNPQHAAGALVVARSDDKRLKRLTDLRNKQVASHGRESFFGMQVVLQELRHATERPGQFFNLKLARQGGLEIAQKVLSGQADAGILKTCELEYFYEHRLIEEGSLKPVGLRRDADIGCMTSTLLYPDLVFAATPHVSAELNTQIAETLLSMPATPQGHRWVVANDFRNVTHVIRRFVSTPLTPEGLQNQLALWRYRYAIFLGVILLLGSVLFGFAVSKMVQNRTRELVKTLEENKKLESLAKKDRERLMQLEKAGIVSELSSIIAHEARQPITSLINYSNGLSLYLKDRKDPVVEEASREIASQALRISQIVERVRSYAKRRDSVHVETDLVVLVKKALQTVRASEEINNVVLVPRLPVRALTSCDPFEIELVIVNLTRNALQAVANLTDEVPYVEVGVRASENHLKWELFVRDNGPSIAPEKIKLLSRPVHSEKIEGLGLGLSICRVIAERHTTRLQFEQVEPHGLMVSLRFDDLGDKGDEKHS